MRPLEILELITFGGVKNSFEELDKLHAYISDFESI